MASTEKHETPEELDEEFSREEIPSWMYYWLRFHMPMKRFWQLYWALLSEVDEEGNLKYPDPVRTIEEDYASEY